MRFNKTPLMRSFLFIVTVLLLGQTSMAQATVEPFEQADVSFVNTLTNDKIWLIKGDVKIFGILIVEPGTIVKGEKASNGTIILQQGATMNANGTVDQPIIFTSDQDPGSRAPGDWGGIIVCGLAPINGGGTLAGGISENYGGGDPTSTAGAALQYARIEYAGGDRGGTRFGALTLAGVGSGWLFNHLQISYSASHSFEILGGTANMDHVLSYRATNDDFHLRDGYAGSMQYGAVLRDPALADDNASAIESVNPGASTPLTAPVITNFTFVGPLETSGGSASGFDSGMNLSDGSQVNLYSSAVIGFPTGITANGNATQGALTSNAIEIRNVYLAGNTADFAADLSYDLAGWFGTGAFANSSFAAAADLELTDPFDLTSNPDFRPAMSSPVVGAADFSAANLAFAEVVGFVGGFGPTEDWTICWANWAPQTTPYEEAMAGFQPVSAEFTSDSYIGDSLEVFFTNLSSEGATKFFWQFGDPSRDDDTLTTFALTPDVSWTYAEPGSFDVRLRASNACGEVDSINRQVLTGVGFDDWLSGAEISLYPNPATDVAFLDFNLSRSEEFSIQLFDMSGRAVLDLGTATLQAGDHRVSLPLQLLDSGYYMVVLSGPGGYEAQPLMVR